MILRGDDRDLPGVPVVKSSPSNAGGVGSIPGGRAEISYVLGRKNKTKQKQHCKKCNKDFKKMVHVKKCLKDTP